MQIHLRKKRLKDGRDSLYLDIYHNGQRSYEFLKLYIKRGSSENKDISALAEKIKAQRLIDLSNREYDQFSTQKKRASFVKYFESRITTENKGSNYYGAFQHLKKFLKGKDITFEKITKNWLDSFSKYLSSDAGLKPNTAFIYFAATKTILFRASEDGFIRYEIIRLAKKLKKVETQRGYLELSEIQKLANTEAGIPDVKRAFLFSCFTGLAIAEIKNLKWGDILNDVIKIERKKTKRMLEIPLSKTALDLIKPNNIHYLPEAKVFNLSRHRSTIIRVLRRWFKVANIEKRATYHLARHSFATLNITAGTDLYTVSKLLGHSDIKTTEIYAKVIDTKKKEAVDRLPEIEVNL